MARRVAWGTPGGRSTRYFFPRPPFGRYALWLAAGAVLFGLFALLEVGGRWITFLRGPVMPGPLIARHAGETGSQCAACHVTGRVANFRCQRCHDEAGPGRMTQAAHVGRHHARARPTDGRESEAAEVDCARCHIEHRGLQQQAGRKLVLMSDAQCVVCHGSRRRDALGERPVVTGFGPGAHPEFAAVASGGPEPRAVNVFFSHRKHLPAARRNMQRQRGGGSVKDEEVCRSCHELEEGASGRRDFAPIDAEGFCFSCHEHSDDLAVSLPLTAELSRDSDDSCREDQGQLRCEHKAPWVRRNLDRLRRQLHPEEHERELAELLGRVARLKRRLFLAEQLAGLTQEALARRREDFRQDVESIQALLGDGAASGPRGSPAARVEEVAAALAAANEADPDLAAEAVRAAAGAPAGAGADFEARRAELLGLLDAVLAAENDPGSVLRRRAGTLRLRLLSLVPGEESRGGARRALAQRLQDLARIDDELELRRAGISASQLAPKLGSIQEAIDQAVERIVALDAVSSAAPAPSEERARKEQALEALVGRAHESGCAHCHVIENATLRPVAPAQSVLTLSEFRHEPHLRATAPAPGLARSLMARLFGTPAPVFSAEAGCEACHAGMRESDKAEDLHLLGIASCRACHGAGQRQDCQLCHRYHPPPRL